MWFKNVEEAMAHGKPWNLVGRNVKCHYRMLNVLPANCASTLAMNLSIEWSRGRRKSRVDETQEVSALVFPALIGYVEYNGVGKSGRAPGKNNFLYPLEGRSSHGF